MTTIYNDSGEQEIRKVILYAHSDNFLYVDAEHKTKVGANALLDMCVKGMVLITTDSKTFYHPIAFKADKTQVTVSVETGTAATAAIKDYKSDKLSS